MDTAIGIVILLYCIGLLRRKWKEDKLLKTNPAAWKAKKDHEEYKKACKRDTLTRGGLAIFRTFMRW
jgi:hypothetical protein